MALSFTKTWSASDDGSPLAGSDIGTIQSDIVSQTCDLASTQTLSGDKTFSGTLNVTGTFQLSGITVAGVDELVFWENAMVAYENDAVFYR